MEIVKSDCLEFLKTRPDGSYNFCYIDPPFNTGKVQTKKTLKTEASKEGTRIGFGGKAYKTTEVSRVSFVDSFQDFAGFMEPVLVEIWRTLKPDGSLMVHLDYREAHYIKVLMDCLFGRSQFMNEIIWAWDYGARAKNKWPCKHNNILWYVKDVDNYTFNLEECDRIPYMAPELVGPEKAAIGKTPTDVFWHTIVPTNGKEKTGYPTQKPLGILERLVKVHTNPNDLILDCFAGSGTTGEAALKNGRDCVLVDNNDLAIQTINTRLEQYRVAL